MYLHYSIRTACQRSGQTRLLGFPIKHHQGALAADGEEPQAKKKKKRFRPLLTLWVHFNYLTWPDRPCDHEVGLDTDACNVGRFVQTHRCMYATHTSLAYPACRDDHE